MQTCNWSLKLNDSAMNVISSGSLTTRKLLRSYAITCTATSTHTPRSSAVEVNKEAIHRVGFVCPTPTLTPLLGVKNLRKRKGKIKDRKPGTVTCSRYSSSREMETGGFHGLPGQPIAPN